MKNITGFYCKQPSLLLNTERKGYKISHRLLPPVPPAPPCSARTQETQRGQTCPGAEAGAWCGCGKGGKGEKSRGSSPAWDTLLWARGVCCPVLAISFQTKAWMSVQVLSSICCQQVSFWFLFPFYFFFFSWFFFFPFFFLD